MINFAEHIVAMVVKSEDGAQFLANVRRRILLRTAYSGLGSEGIAMLWNSCADLSSLAQKILTGFVPNCSATCWTAIRQRFEARSSACVGQPLRRGSVLLPVSCGGALMAPVRPAALTATPWTPTMGAS